MARLTFRIAASICAAMIFVIPAAALPARSNAAGAPIQIGAVFPLRAVGPLARQEYRGVRIAAQLVNARGGIAGRPIELDTRELDTPAEAGLIMNLFRQRGIRLVIGAYSSELSIPTAAAAARDGLVYWEAGAVADRLTGQGLPTVFRVGANGSDLGSNSAYFTATQLAPRLRIAPAKLRVAVVSANDAYADSVAQAAIRVASLHHLMLVGHLHYALPKPNFGPVIDRLKQLHPNVIILASHIPDGVAFTRAMRVAHLRVDAFIGSTMAECVPEFGTLLGSDATGVFASDRPRGGFNPRALDPAARHVYNLLVKAWKAQTGQSQPTEEGLAGFSAAWALFHDVLPRAARSSLTVNSIVAAARAQNLPTGSLPNGAGLRFATDRSRLGQNMRAAAVIWQWQQVRHSVVVWPRTYAT